MADTGDAAARYRDVFAVGEFRALFAAHLQSVLGDQLARVALSVLVFDRTGSPALAAVTYALTFIPDLVGGPLLAGLADRYPRRSLMVVCDLVRAVLVAVMAIGGMPIWALVVLLVGVQLVGAPFKAARAAVLPAILDGDRFVVGNGVMNTTFQLGLLGGFAGGAPLVAWLGTGWALVLDAITFGVSAALIAVGLRPHPPGAGEAGTKQRTTLESLRAGTRLVWHDHQLRYLLALACLAGFLRGHTRRPQVLRPARVPAQRPSARTPRSRCTDRGASLHLISGRTGRPSPPPRRRRVAADAARRSPGSCCRAPRRGC